MIDWGVSYWFGYQQSYVGHAIIDGEPACGTYGVYSEEYRVKATLPASQRPQSFFGMPGHINRVCRRCDAYVRKHF